MGLYLCLYVPVNVSWLLGLSHTNSRCWPIYVLNRCASNFYKVFGGHMSFFGATGTPVLDFWWHLLWVSKPEWVLPYSLFCRGECNVHSLRSTSGATLADVHRRLPPHMHVQRWDLVRIRTGNPFWLSHKWASSCATVRFYPHEFKKSCASRIRIGCKKCCCEWTFTEIDIFM